jgi:hypothetical protein
MDIICRIALGQKDSQQLHNPYLENVKGIFDRPANNALVVCASLLPAFLRPVYRKIANPIAELRGIPIARLKKQVADAVNDRRRIKVQYIP